MYNNFKAVSLSFKKAPLDVREVLTMNEQDTKNVLRVIQEHFGVTDALILSTCNRTEVYYCSDTDLSDEVIKLLCLEKGIAKFNDYIPYFRKISDHEKAVLHLYRVSMGLNSQVIGDIQISNQVKTAYQWSADVNMAGPFLHRLLHSIFYTNKRVVQETSYRDGAASTSFSAVELTEELTVNINSPRILVAGIGEIGIDVCKNFENTNLDNIVLINRTFEKADRLAKELGYRAVDFSEMETRIKEADVIISSIQCDTPFFSYEKLKDLTVVSGKFFIDLAVPRSVDKKLEEISGVLVYNIDDLRERTNEVVENRKKSIPQVEAIINEAIADFQEWSKEMEVSPTIHKLKNTLEEIRKTELARHIKKLSPEEWEKMDQISKDLMQKVIKLPVLQLKAACKRGEAETLIDVLNDLFDLEKQSEHISE